MCVSVFLAPFCHFFRCWKENDKRETMGDGNGLGSGSSGGRGRGEGEVIKFYVSKNKYVKTFCLLR